METICPIKVQLTLVLFVGADGLDRFRIHALVDGQDEPVDVTDQYEVLAAEILSTGRKGFTVVKK